MQDIIGFCAEAKSTNMFMKFLTGGSVKTRCDELAGRLTVVTDTLMAAVALDTASMVTELGGGMQEALGVLRRQADALVRLA